jgi:hypothetical protein
VAGRVRILLQVDYTLLQSVRMVDMPADLAVVAEASLVHEKVRWEGA